MTGRLQDKVAVVTGANSGVGESAADLLARAGARVTMICRSRERGEEALAGLRRGAPEAETGLMQWDVGFWSERLREARYELKEEDLRPYFQLPAVIDGMFALASKLFGIEVVAADGEVEVDEAA